MHYIIETKMETLKHDLSTHLESFTSLLCTKMNIPEDLTSSDPPLQPECETSSNSKNFPCHQFQCDLCLPRVDVKNFDGLDPMG
jgi:hypothetical protein